MGKKLPMIQVILNLPFSYTGNGAIFIYASGSTVNSLELKISSTNTDLKTSINKPGEGLLISPNSGNNF